MYVIRYRPGGCERPAIGGGSALAVVLRTSRTSVAPTGVSRDQIRSIYQGDEVRRGVTDPRSFLSDT